MLLFSVTDNFPAIHTTYILAQERELCSWCLFGGCRPLWYEFVLSLSQTLEVAVHISNAQQLPMADGSQIGEDKLRTFL